MEAAPRRPPDAAEPRMDDRGPGDATRAADELGFLPVRHGIFALRCVAVGGLSIRSPGQRAEVLAMRRRLKSVPVPEEIVRARRLVLCEFVKRGWCPSPGMFERAGLPRLERSTPFIPVGTAAAPAAEPMAEPF